jgi:hypothetical protein
MSITVLLPPETILNVSSNAEGSTAIVRRLSDAAGSAQRQSANKLLFPNINLNELCSTSIGPFSEQRRYLIDNIVGDITYTTELIKLNYNNLSSGVYEGGALSVNSGDNTKFDIVAGKGIIMDNYTDPENPVVVRVEWPAFTAQTTEYLATDFTSYVVIDKGGNVVQFNGDIDAVNRRDYIVLGLLVHTGNSFLENVSNFPTIGYDAVNVLNDLSAALGLVNISGNLFSANATDLELAKSAGQSFRVGNNFTNSVKSPNITNDSALSAPFLFKPYQDGTGNFTIDFPLTQDVDPANYDDGSGTLGLAGNNWQIQRIFYDSANDDVIVAYGQNIYANLGLALAAINAESFVKNPVLKDAMLRGFLVIRGNCTDLSDTSRARFFGADKFGQVPAEGSQLTVPAGFLTTSTALKTGTFTANWDKAYRVDNSGGAVTANLVAATEADIGRVCECWVLDDATTNTVTFVAPNTDSTINGQASVGAAVAKGVSSGSQSYRRVTVRVIDTDTYLIDGIDSTTT